jgi:biopolymer transport protein ExbB
LTAEVIYLTQQGKVTDETIDELEKNAFLGTILAAGLRAYSYTTQNEDIGVVVEATGKQVTQKLERNLIPLATIASAAPLIGLLGTVIGLIQIFSAQGAQLGLNMDTSPAELAYGISIALYSTAFGLIIAIPSLIFWRYFRSLVDTYLLQLELDAARFVRFLKGFG